MIDKFFESVLLLMRASVYEFFLRVAALDADGSVHCGTARCFRLC